MTSQRNGENVNQNLQSEQQCSIYLFPPTLATPPSAAAGAGDSAGVVSSRINLITSTSRGHARSASHGGVGTSLAAGGTSGAVRPSALKQGGHQRAFSQGQMVVDSAGLSRGHSRVGSRTDFILPPGHRDTENATSSTSLRPTRGHSRQASRSESIYTLRHTTPPTVWDKFWNCVFRRGGQSDSEDPPYRIVVPNHMVPQDTPKSDHPNGRQPDNRIRTTKYTLLSFLPKNLLEQLHRVANVYFICIVLLNWVPAINAFGKEIAMLPVLFVLGVTAIKDLFEDRRRHASDKRINNSTCRVYKSVLGRYTKVLWKDLQVGDLIHLSNNEVIPADILMLRSSSPNGLAYIDTCNLDGETNLKLRQVARGFLEKQDVFEPNKFLSVVEVDRPTTKIYRFHGAIIHPTGERVSVNSDNLLLRECVMKNTDYVEGIVVYAGHETKAMLNNGGPRYKRSTLERQMNIDVIWCVVILLVLCVVGAFGCKLWLSSYEGLVVPFVPYAADPLIEAILSFWTFVIILQVMIPLSLYVTMEMAKLLQVFHIHNDIGMYDPETNKRVECRALNIPEELGQVQYIFSDKTGTLTENKMIFRSCSIGGVEYNHPPPDNAQNLQGVNRSVPMPLLVNPALEEELSVSKLKTVSSKRVQEFLLVLSMCNTVVVANHPHHDAMNSSGVIETPPNFSPQPTANRSSNAVLPRSSSNAKTLVDHERYTRLSESRSSTPSPPRAALDRPTSDSTLQQKGVQGAPDDSVSPPHQNKPSRPKRLIVPALLLVGGKRSGTKVASSPQKLELKPIYEAESPDELALVHAAHSYNIQLIKRTPQNATVLMPSEGMVDFEILQVLPFDSTRKCMSIVVRNPITKHITLYCKGADSAVLAQLASTESGDALEMISRTQAHLNEYARKGLRVLVVAKRIISDADYKDWLSKHRAAETHHDNHERRKRDSYALLETNLTLLGATGIEDRLQEGVPEAIAALIEAGIAIWVLTGDKPETAINIAYSARLFSPQMELLKLFARSKEAAEAAIVFYLADIEGETTPDGSMEGVGGANVDVFSRASLNSENVPTSPRGLSRHSKKPRALVVDGKTLTYILDKRSNLQKPFLALTQYCHSVLCCRSTPLQKAYIVRIVKEELGMRTLAIGDGANDVSMIQTADVGVGISGQEGMQAVMASDFALSRFKYLERFLLVHGHWCYDRLARMVLYFFYKNATFVFLIFWYQLYCGFSGGVMVDQMYLMLYNLLFTSLSPIAIGVYDKDVSADVLLSNPGLYRQGRLGLVYQPHSFWLTIADSMYQSIVIFFLTEGAYHDSDIGIWEFGTTITTASMFVMLVHVGIETRAWTIIHVMSIVISILTYFIFSLMYNTFCVHCFGLPNNYWVVQKAMMSPTYWLVIFLAVVLALLPRFVVRGVEQCFYPTDGTRAMLDKRQAKQRGEEFLVSWSRSTSTSSIYRCHCFVTVLCGMLFMCMGLALLFPAYYLLHIWTAEYATKCGNSTNLTVVG